MRKYLLVLLATILTTITSYAQQPAQTITGSWNGSLAIGGAKLRLVFNLSANPDGSLTATMDSPDQGAKGIPVTSARLVQDSLYLDIKAIGGSYVGKVTGPETIDGYLKQAGQTMHIPLTKGEATEAKRPQHPVKPYPYQETEVTIENKTAGITLAGTLTIPKGKTKAPAVVLITGSGPQDRDQTILGHKSFLVLADYLTRQGFAVLRLDDRGVGKSGGNFAAATTEDFAFDTEAAFTYLKNFEGVDGKKVGLLGHSEGALVAAKVAAKHPETAFVVLMAGSAVPGTDLLLAQNEALLKATGMPDAQLQNYLQLRKAQFTVAATETDIFKASQTIKQLEQEAKTKLTAEEQKQMGLTPQSEQAIVAQLSSPWTRYFLGYNPAPTLQKLKMPVLALNGTKDLQVPYQQNLPATEKALRAAVNKKYTIKEMSNLNHLFQTATTGMVNEYGQLEETIAPAALEVIGNWMKGVVK
ncbi:alpha/beta fold hydrolase [Pontibacter sp. BT310]|uniref:Alpha/beta fold hydrolase n=1 Tax=Pontibacter populi TaxID=890055 RepID=A0ABS6XGH4_9BACT|nr:MULTISPECIES: alpha/beta fold hydrolase [Pontibacter]MBJ6119362.1 alpha/beta fold hydrolase [Pontibacter sp. BT310]MBR0571790.1 alpha/beta fold hydrolase [Microvirga sp. STS03]MBW3366216.1 alpha/beta fold hydrolase [Pontibacter populi]